MSIAYLALLCIFILSKQKSIRIIFNIYLEKIQIKYSNVLVNEYPFLKISPKFVKVACG